MDAVEGSVRDCDTLADRLRREADRVARGHGLKTERAAKKRLIEDCEANLERLKSEYQQAQTNWRMLWEPSGIDPDVPEVMSGWLVQVERLREKTESWRDNVEKCRRLARRCEELVKLIALALPESAKRRLIARCARAGSRADQSDRRST